MAGPAATALPAGAALYPADIASAYALPTVGGAGITVGIIDAYDNPSAESDLAAYRSQFGLSPCTTANGCFRKINQRGSSSPLPNSGWALEVDLDLAAVSASCRSCNILLVEGDTATTDDLFSAASQAVTSGATWSA